MLGYTVSGTEVTIRHIATASASRRTGIGTRLLAALQQSAPGGLPIVAETDSEAIGFYRTNGFTIRSLGETYPGVERFQVRSC